ncbi:MAG: iron-sulfur cluster assembly protein [candidate division KSB1 bacterium]|nr:iron-sulfur cluster assembly protein [candidate division KSB1 bacterium]MDZ7302655.1 iron-sulfur cluster assembly protein [candidate division KSB1 bacterium]MDZ7311815.1 iron-sulfur cluster assembly protein [candidate division KSB1 bacterium]
MPTKEDILKKLQSVNYPGYSRDIVSFGLVKDVRACGNMAALKLELVTKTANSATNCAKACVFLVTSRSAQPSASAAIPAHRWFSRSPNSK